MKHISVRCVLPRKLTTRTTWHVVILLLLFCLVGVAPEAEYNLLCVVRLVSMELCQELQPPDLNDGQWITRHDLNGQLTYSDPR